MNTNEEFDELARRKLEERSFTFHEPDWEQARKLIDHSRGRRPWTQWVAGSGMVVVLAGLLWLGTRDDHAATTMAEHVPAVSTFHSTTATGPTVSTGQKTAQPQHSPHAPAQGDAVEMIAGGSIRAPGTTLPDSTLRTEPRPDQAAVPTTAERPVRNKPASPRTGGTVVPAAPQDGRSITALSMDHIAQARSSVESNGLGAIPPKEMSEQATGTGRHSLSAHMPGSVDTQGTQQQHGPGAIPATDSTAPEAYRGPAAPAFTRESAPTRMRTIGQGATTLPLASPLAAATSVVPYHAPWEISVLAGGLASTNHYSGGNSAEWVDGVTSANSLGFGAELVHMGRHLGLGFGLHYGTYAERLRLDALDATTLSYHAFWFLMAVDTSVLVITDTLPGTPPTYNGQNMDTTLYVLAQGTDTVVGHQRLRDAHDRTNRLSYVEVPLLADVHLVQGRWILGLRGGPTVGLLTGRRGSLPTGTDGGMVAYTEQPFSELMIGYTARAYVRYRFNAGWSIGLEPVVRGQLLNGLDRGALESKRAAQGVMMSLSYRLR